MGICEILVFVIRMNVSLSSPVLHRFCFLMLSYICLVINILVIKQVQIIAYCGRCSGDILS